MKNLNNTQNNNKNESNIRTSFYCLADDCFCTTPEIFGKNQTGTISTYGLFSVVDDAS